MNFQNTKIGVLGGGQLGRMLVQKGIDWNLKFSILDPDPEAPCKGISDFTIGKLTDAEAVMNFAKALDIITIEIENVSADALKQLERAGKKVFPQPRVIELIQDKRLQKKFYSDHKIPTADFVLTQNRQEVLSNVDFLPAVNKL